mmetsp:Transcript_25777/g.84837  ORF Transcript_25777/g.84837 Transcript_25777/m.84837 type:complete len:379 (-) Transcript_25777:699-1835(-)
MFSRAGTTAARNGTLARSLSRKAGAAARSAGRSLKAAVHTVVMSATDGSRRKRAVVTGANTGLGKVAALELAKSGYDVVLACRSIGRGETAATEVREAAPDADVAVEHLDLADLASVRKFASKAFGGTGSIDLLVNNAAVMALPERTETMDGFEMQLGTNFLGPFLLTSLLLPRLLTSGAGRIVNVSSIAHEFGSIDFANLQSEGFWGYSLYGWPAYGQSKLAQILFTLELDRRLRAAGASLCVNACHPGFINTELPRNLGLANPYPLLTSLNYTITPEQAAQGMVALAKAGEYEGVSGVYVAEQAVKGAPGEHAVQDPSAAARDEETARRLFDVATNLTGADWGALAPANAAPETDAADDPAPAAPAAAEDVSVEVK